ncbi:MAG: hypothetical protein RR942_01320 [Romboutsia sp.]
MEFKDKYMLNIEIIKQQAEADFIEWIKNNIKKLSEEEDCDFDIKVYRRA